MTRPVFTAHTSRAPLRLALTRALLTLALFCAPHVVARAQSTRTAPQDDVQNWNEVQLTVPLADRLDLNLIGQLRIGDRLRDFADERPGFNVTYTPSRYLSVAPGYFYIAMQQPVTRRRTYEHRFTFAATVRLPSFREFTISDRNTVERRLLHSRPDVTRYRNRLQVERPVSPGGFDMRLFVSDEIFYDFSQRAWTRNRFTIGGSRALDKRTTFDLYYLRQNDGRGRPGDIHAIGTSLRFRL